MVARSIRAPRPRRGFLLAALLVGTAVPAFTIVVLLHQPLAVVAAVLVVGRAVALAWVGLNRHGLGRVPVVAIAGLAPALTAAVPQWRGYLWFVLVAALVAIAVAAGRALWRHAHVSVGVRPSAHGVLLMERPQAGAPAGRFGQVTKAPTRRTTGRGRSTGLGRSGDGQRSRRVPDGRPRNRLRW